MEYKDIAVEEQDGIGRIVLKRPPLNLLNIEMMREINDALGYFRSRTLRALVIRAEGKAFSAGVDVAEHTQEKVEEMIRAFHGIFSHLQHMECPTVAFVNGAALGGGCEVAIFCDIVLASERAKFGQPEIKVGVFPPVAAALMPKIIHGRKALELLLTGEPVPAEEARELGLVSQVLRGENFEEEAEKWVVDHLVSKSAAVLRVTKKAFLEGFRRNYADAIEVIEDIYLNELMRLKDPHEGLAAFLEKRQPRWRDE